jgi:hypothetical protein
MRINHLLSICLPRRVASCVLVLLGCATMQEPTDTGPIMGEVDWNGFTLSVELVDGKPHGMGTGYYGSDSTSYTCAQFQEGKMSGCFATFSDGEPVWVARFEDGQPQEYCEICLNCGTLQDVGQCGGVEAEN